MVWRCGRGVCPTTYVGFAKCLLMGVLLTLAGRGMTVRLFGGNAAMHFTYHAFQNGCSQIRPVQFAGESGNLLLILQK